MTEEQIAELRGLLSRATPGPWEVYDGDAAIVLAFPDHVATTILDTLPPDCRTAIEAEKNAALIAAARTALPGLLDEVERLKRLLSEGLVYMHDSEGRAVAPEFIRRARAALGEG